MKLDEGACIFGAGVLLKHREDLEEEIKGVRGEQQDTDPVHDARVASRRLRAALPLFEDCLPKKKAKKWLKQIRRTTRALGAARDTDVQLEWLKKVYKTIPDPKYKAGVNRLTLRLRQKRTSLQGPLDKAMKKLTDSGILDQMSEELQPLASRKDEVYLYTPSLYQHSFQSIHSRLEDFLAYDAIVYQPEKVTELHQMRIAAKWLRYTIETFAPLYSDQLQAYQQAIRTIQDLLGDIHDSDVWIQFLPKFLEEERQRTLDYFGHDRPYYHLFAGILFLEEIRRQKRIELYDEFVGKWSVWQAGAFWDGLRRAIQIPFLRPDEIYPPIAQAPDQPEAQ